MTTEKPSAAPPAASTPTASPARKPLLRRPVRPWMIFAAVLFLAAWISYDQYQNKRTQQLLTAIDRGQYDEVVRLVESGARVNGAAYSAGRSSDGAAYYTPLLFAIDNDRQEIESFLRSKGARLTYWRDPDAAFVAVVHGEEDELKVRLRMPKALNWQDMIGQSLMHYAVSEVQIGSVRVLLENGFDPDDGEDSATPLMTVIEYFHSEDEAYPFIEILLAHGASINITNREGKTPLQLAEDKGWTRAAQLLKNEE